MELVRAGVQYTYPPRDKAPRREQPPPPDCAGRAEAERGIGAEMRALADNVAHEVVELRLPLGGGLGVAPDKVAEDEVSEKAARLRGFVGILARQIEYRRHYRGGQYAEYDPRRREKSFLFHVIFLSCNRYIIPQASFKCNSALFRYIGEADTDIILSSLFTIHSSFRKSHKEAAFLMAFLLIYSSSFLMPNIVLSMPDRKRGLLMTTIFTMYPPFNGITPLYSREENPLL